MDTQWLPRIDPLLCTGCGRCVERCPEHALALVADKAVLARPEACTFCQICADICPEDAIDLPYLICFTAVPPDPPASQRAGDTRHAGLGSYPAGNGRSKET